MLWTKAFPIESVDCAHLPTSVLNFTDSISCVSQPFYSAVQLVECTHFTDTEVAWFCNLGFFMFIIHQDNKTIWGRRIKVPFQWKQSKKLYHSLTFPFFPTSIFSSFPVLQVPDRFLEVAQVTLREFFNAIVAGKDADPSWKKAIYKVICKLDSEVPEVFKSPNCLQELLHDWLGRRRKRSKQDKTPRTLRGLWDAPKVQR